MKKFKLRFVLIAALFILTACGGGGGGGSSQQVGQFIDDPVAGLSYSCVNASQTIAGTTDNQGNFNYLPGQTCTFKVGNVTLGSPSAIPSDGKVTPQDVAGVSRAATAAPSALAIAQFLQSLNDGTNAGKIVIPAATSVALSKAPVITLASSSGVISQSDLQNIVINAGKTLVSATTAKGALDAQIASGNVIPSAGSVSVNSPVLLNSITLTSGASSSPAGMPYQFTATGNYSDGSSKDLTTTATWSTSNGSVATVSSGLVKGVKVGTAVVTATHGSISGNAPINITPAVLQSISISPASPSIAAGYSTLLTLVATYSDGSTVTDMSNISWKSSDTGVASSNANGVISGLTQGTSTITASVEGITSSPVIFTVGPPTLVSFVISSATNNIQVGTTLALNAIARFSDATTQTISSLVNWIVTPSSTATIVNGTNSNSASLIAKATGNVTVTASYNNLTTEPIVLNVTPLTGRFNGGVVSGLTYSCAADGMQTFSGITNNQGQFSYLLNQRCTFSVGNITIGTVASVPLDGVVTPQDLAGVVRSATSAAAVMPIGAFLQSMNDGSSPGVITIPKSVTQALSDSSVVPVTLVSPKTGVATSASLSKILSIVAKAVPSYSGATLPSAGEIASILQREIDSGVVKVSSGLITNLTPLTLTSISLTNTPISLPSGVPSSVPLIAMGNYSDGTTKDVSPFAVWSTSDSLIATIVSGNIKAVNKGSAILSVSSGSISALSEITVTPAVLQKITVSNTANPPAGLTDQLKATGIFSDGSTENLTKFVTWSSSDKKIVTVDANGLATGLVKGVATVTASFTQIAGAAAIVGTLTETVVDPTPLNIIISYVQSGLTSINYMTSTILQAILSYSDSSTQLVSSLVNWVVSTVSGGGAGTVAVNTLSNTAAITGTAPGVISTAASYLGLNSNSLLSTVLPPPTITSQPSSLSVYESATATFNVVATDAGPISYQWRKNGALIIGATSPSYTITAATISDNNSVFTVQVTGATGAISSVNALLTVLPSAPSIVTPPSSQSVIAGQNAQFTVTAAGLPNLTYQWYKNGNLITGATSNIYATPATIGDSGSVFSVKVTNSVNNITSSNATLTVQQSSLTDLVISEVSSCFYIYSDCWFEVYNPTSSSVNLNAYTIKSTSKDISSLNISTQTYSLPSLILAPDSYVILSGNYYNKSQIGVQNIKLRNGSNIPSWDSNGFIEIIKNGATADFVVFGNSTQKPTSTAKWNGVNVPQIPSFASDYGKSIARPYPRTADTNTYSAADWTALAWVTPAGRNDIAAGVLDSDGDGIPDSAEVSGGTYAGLDLYAMGARANQKDIFIEIDQMISTDPGIIVRKEALQKMVDVFAANSIKVHIDAGNAFKSTFSTVDFNLGQGSNQVAYEKCVGFDQTTCISNSSSRRSIYDWKEQYMDLRRRLIFHYALFANSQNANGAAGSSGRAEVIGNDLLITLGSLGVSTATDQGINIAIHLQAGTLMHELGHNLGLLHGGDENTNYKPNYLSVMNYLHQFNGLDPDPKSITAYQRWRSQKGDSTPNRCDLVASPCGSTNQFILNYSNGTSSNLNEASLLESSNIGRGANVGAYADWNLDGSLTATPVSRDLNADGALTILKDHNDWSNLVFPFARNYQGNFGASLRSSDNSLPVNLIGNDRQPISVEYDSIPRW